MDVVRCWIGKGDADVVDCGRGRFCFAVGGWRKVCFVDADGVVELDWRQRSEVWLKNVGKIGE